MGFLSFFKGKKDSKEVNYLKHLIKVAVSDGNFDSSEMEFIYKVARKLNIPESDVNNIKKDIHDVKLRKPEDFKARFQLLFDLVWLMMLDDELTENEIKICTKVAQVLGYEPEIVQDLVKAIGDNLSETKDKETTYNNILATIK